MSLNSILSNATSGLYASQSGIKTVSQNISNVNTQGYVRVEHQQSTVNLAGTNGGVQVDALRRAANKFLQTTSLNANSDAANQDVKAQYLDQLQAAFGDPSGASSLFSKVNNTLGAFETAVLSPGSNSIRRDIISQLQSLLSAVSNVSNEVQTIRSSVDQNVADTVKEINTLLTDIAKSNADVMRGINLGDATGAQEQQSQLLEKLSTLIDIRVDYRDGGMANVYTSDGVLLTGYKASELTYNPAPAGQPFYDSIGIKYGDDPVIRELEPSIQNGQLRGLIDLRNSDLAELAEYIGEFSGKLADAINAEHNTNSSLPALSNTTGSDTGLLAADSLGFSGNTTIGIVDSAGVLLRKININFSANTISVDGGAAVGFGGTIAGFTSALNTSLGAFGSASFANGKMSLNTSNAANGLVFDEPATGGSLRGDKAFAHFFGLNNLINATQPTNFATGLSGTDAHGFGVGQNIGLRLNALNGAVITEKTIPISGTSINDILASLNNGSTGLGLYGNFAIDTKGSIKFTPNPGSESLKVEMTEDTLPRSGTSVSFGQLFGFNQNSRTMRGSTLSVNTAISGNPQKLALAKPDLTNIALGSVAVGLGDSAGAEALFSVASSRMAFNTSLGLGSRAMTLGDFVSSLAGELSTRATNAEASKASANALLSEANTRRSNIEGVNLDEELIKLTSYQQAYSAAARMIKAADEMYQSLLNAL